MLLAHFLFINEIIIYQLLKTLVKKNKHKISNDTLKIVTTDTQVVAMAGPNTSAVLLLDILFNQTNKKGIGSHKVEVAVEL